MSEHEERAELLREAAQTPRPGSIEEAEAIDLIDRARWEDARDERRTAERRRRRDWGDDE